MPPINKRQSYVWNHFTLSECKKKVKCIHCLKELAYSLASMSNLKRHTKRKHPDVLRSEPICEVEESPIEIYTIEEVGKTTEETSHLETYGITIKGFEEMDKQIDQEEQDPHDKEWLPETSSASSPKKEKKQVKRSVIWNHFEKLDCKTFAQCLHCGNKIKLGTISNLFRHMRSKHPTVPAIPQKLESSLNQRSSNDEVEEHILRNEVEICTEVIEINVDDIQHPLNIIETKTLETKDMDMDFQFEEMDTINVTQASQTEFLDDCEDFDIYDYIRPKRTAVLAEQVDDQLLKTIVKGCHNINIVEQPAFKEFVKLLNPKYELPTVSKVTQELIPQCYEEYEKKACKSFKSAEGICLYIDQWKSKISNYMCMTAHLINNDCQFEAVFLSCHILSFSESPADISERFHQTVNDWDIAGKIVAVITDNTELISSAVKLCNWPHIPHFVRTLSVVLHESLQTIKTFVNKVKFMIEGLKKRPDTLAKIYSVQKTLKLEQVKLVTTVKDDSSSSFIMVEMLTRFSKLKKAIVQVQETSDDPGIKLNENEWKVLHCVVEVLGVFREVKKEIMGDVRTSMSKVVFYLNILKREMNRFRSSSMMQSDATYLATIAETKLTEHFKDLEGIDLTSNILLLDPRLKKYVFDDESEFASACSKLKKEVCEVILPDLQYCDPNAKSLWKDFDNEVSKLNAVKDPIGKGILELENYLQEQLLARDKDPLVWWMERRAIYPRMFKLAKKYLCVTAKSAARESISSQSALMLSHFKCGTSASIQSEVMFLHHNM